MTDSEFKTLWTRLVAKKRGNDGDVLTKHERLFYAANWLRGSVPRSGFVGYYENSTGDEIRDAHQALETMSLGQCLDVLKQAQALILAGAELPDGARKVHVFPDDLSEEEYIEVSDKLDIALRSIEERFYECDDAIFAALCAYADEHNLSQ